MGADTLEQKVEERTRKLRAAEAGAVEREKLASVGLLAAGIAHELNNPLTGVLTFSHLIRKKLPDGSQDAEDLDLVIRETKRCATIIRRLLDFAREKPPEKKFADLNEVIEDTVRIVERPANLHDIEIALDLDPALPQVWIDADLIKQVVMNMLVNAQHAIADKGSITVRSRRVPEPRSAEPGAPPVPMVEISITDTGCGIPAENLQADLRSVLHLEGRRQGHRARPVGEPRHRQGARRRDRGRKHGRRGLDVPHLPAGGTAAAGARDSRDGATQ